MTEIVQQSQRGKSLDQIDGNIFLKWYFTNARRIPQGIPEVARASDAEMDARHAKRSTIEGEANPIAEVGRVREGRVDTGRQVFDNEARVGSKYIRRRLAENGFQLAGLSWYRQVKPGKQVKFVVVAVYSRFVENPEEVTRRVEAQLRRLEELSSFCHVWDNPNGNVTVNFVGIQDGAPMQQLVIEDGVLDIVPAEK